MNTIRKLIYRPKKSDTSFLAQFYYADEQLNLIATELDSFDGRKDPERCTTLVSQLRHSQDEVLAIIEKIMVSAVSERLRAPRDYRVKFPDDVLHDSLAGQLWFGAECLAAGSSIMNREVESASMRPLAKSLTRHLDSLRSLLREQCLRNQNVYTDKICESLIEFDKIFAEFELSYVSAMVPVKTMREYDLLQDVTVLFCETILRALRLRLLTQDMIDAYEPALMFTIPRLAIVCGLLIYPEGPINPDMDPLNMCEMFRPFQTLLYKIRELLWTLNQAELHTLETALCTSVEEPDQPTTMLANLSTNEFPVQDEGDHDAMPTMSDDTYFEDSSDNEPSTSMVHSESTMTVVAARNATSGINSEDVNGEIVADLQPGILPDAEARQLQHSLSWPQPAENQRIVAAAGESPASSSSSSAIAQCGVREFILTLPCNTSIERLSTLDQPDHDAMNATNDGGIIYLSTTGVVQTSNGPRQQVTFVTDEFCRLFGGADVSDDGDSPRGADGKTASLMSTLMHDGADVIDSCQRNNDEIRTLPTSSAAQNSRTSVEAGDVSQPPASSVEQRFSAPAAGRQQRVTSRVSVTAIKKPSVPVGLPSTTRSSVKAGVTTSIKCQQRESDATKPKIGRRSRRNGFPRSLAQSWSRVDVTGLRSTAPSAGPGLSNGLEIGRDYDSCCSSDTSSYSSESRDDEEIALAIQAAEAAARQEARSRFKSAADLIHRLFVCISGVADQLQTNYATDLRHILKTVFECNTSEAVAQLEAAENSSPGIGSSTTNSSRSADRVDGRQAEVQAERRSRSREPPNWVPDTDSDVCMACHSAFTFVKRRHHCRNCGKLFCAHCSSNVVPLPHYGHEKPVRVCNHCYVFHVTPFTMFNSSSTRSQNIGERSSSSSGDEH